MHVMQMIDSRKWDGAHVTVELEEEASSSHLVKTHTMLKLQAALNRTGGERSPHHEESEWSLTYSLM